MNQIKKILTPVDFSPSSAAALMHAVRIASQSKATVTAMHVVQVPFYGLVPPFLIPLEMPSVDYLVARARERWAKWPAAREAGDKVVFETVVGVPSREILDRVGRDGIDMLVMGSYGEFDRQEVLGSTTATCVQRAPTRVLVVRGGSVAPFRSVVACIDFSDTSRLALEQAIRVAAQDDSALHVVHVYSDPWLASDPPAGVQAHMPDFAERFAKAVEKHLHSFCEPLAHELTALKAKFHAVQFDQGGHGRGIVDFVNRHNCDLAVLGTRGTWNARDFIWGATAGRVVRDAPCAVLTVPPAQAGES